MRDDKPAKGLSRRKAREQALTVLYQRAMGQDEPDLGDDPLVLTLDAAVREHAAAYDALIIPHLRNWTIDRLAVIDLSILRMALAEMLHCRTAPLVVINEALDLAKKFSEPDASKYINGILDSIMREQGLDRQG